MRESFTYLFKDNKWVIKFLAIFIFICAYTYGGHFYITTNRSSEFVLPFVYWLPMALGCLITYIIASGYKILCVTAFQIPKNNCIVPPLNLKSAFKTGFKYLLAWGLFNLCCLIFIAISGLITGLSIFTNVTFARICIVTFMIILLFYWIYIIITEFGSIYMYAKKPDIYNFFRIKELFSGILSHKKQYFIALGWNILLYLLILLFYWILNYLFIYKLKPLTALFINTLIMSSFGTYKFFVSNMLAAKSLENCQTDGE